MNRAQPCDVTRGRPEVAVLALRFVQNNKKPFKKKYKSPNKNNYKFISINNNERTCKLIN